MISMDGVIWVEESPKKTFIDRVLWAILGSMSCSTKSGSFLGLCWARVGLVVGQTLTFDIKHLKKNLIILQP